MKYLKRFIRLIIFIGLLPIWMLFLIIMFIGDTFQIFYIWLNDEWISDPYFDVIEVLRLCKWIWK